MPTNSTDVVNPGYSVNALTPIILTLDPVQGEQGAPGSNGQSMNWRGVWQTGLTYKAYDSVSRNGASYIAIVNNTSVDPATDNGTVWGLLSAPGAVGPPGPAGVNYRGAWNSATAYAKNDLVTQLGNSYIAVAPSTNINPGTDGGTHWQLFAAAGSGGDMYKSQFVTGAGAGNSSEVDRAMAADAVPWTGVSGKPVIGDMTKAVYDTNNDGIADKAAQVPWTGVTGAPSAMPPTAHETTHLVGGTDPLPLAGSGGSGLMRATSGLTTDFVDGTNTCQGLAGAVTPIVQPVIWSARLRSFNAVGNPNFEVAQRNCGTILNNPANGAFLEDRWTAGNLGPLNQSYQRLLSPGVVVPGTAFAISAGLMRMTVVTQKTSLAAGDLAGLVQAIEGPMFREIVNDVHSVSLLVRSSVANLKFGLYLRDAPPTRSLTKLCTLGAANTLTLIQLPNLPVWPSAGNFTTAVGLAAYSVGIILACGSTYTSPANDTWQTGNFLGALGQDNLMATAGATFDVFFVQHEPGAVCTMLIDKPFTQNYDECLRYYQKTFNYSILAGSASPGYGFGNFNVVAVNAAMNGGLYMKPMAKVPTVAVYNGSSGASGTAWDNNAGAVTAAVAPSQISEKTFDALTGSGLTAGHILSAHYTADTGW